MQDQSPGRDTAKHSLTPSLLGRVGSFLAGAWFPAALLILFVLAVPGVAFFLLALLGAEHEANEWLQENFDISYRLPLDDARLAWILILLPLFILILYFLKLKRQPLQVPSTFLWKKSIEDLHVNSLLQWLRKNVLLLLQLLIVLFLIYAILGFRIHASVARGKYYILMIDNSASMSATDADGQSRLEWAKNEAYKEIDAAREGDNGMVIVFNARASTLQSYTSDKAKLRQAVASIQPTNKATRIEEALNLADSLANQLVSTEEQSVRPDNEKPGEERSYDTGPKGKPTEVYLFSDGRFPDLSETALAQLNSKRAGNTSALGNLNLHFRSAGKPGAENVNNIGIVAFNILRVPDKNEEADPTVLKLQALVRVANFRATAARDVKLYLDVLVNDQPEHALQQTVTLEKRTLEAATDENEKIKDDVPGQQTVIFKLPPLDATANIVLHAYLPDVKDDFPLDNQAWVAVGQKRKAKVLLVGEKNQILEAFFLQKAVGKLAIVDRLAPVGLDTPKYRQAALGGEYDLVIFDRCGPKELKNVPQANTLYIDQPPPPWERGNKILKDTPLYLSGKNHPLLQQILILESKTGVHELFTFDPETSLQAQLRDQYTTKPGEKGKKLLPGITRLVETQGDVPAVFTVGRGAYTDVVLTFALVDDKANLTTNWPLKQSFALFLRNVLYVLGNIQDEVRADSVHAGEPMTLRPEGAVQSLTIISPSGTKQVIKKEGRTDFVFSNTEELGVYTVRRDDGGTQHFTVNLLDANESNLQPRDAVKIGDEAFASGSQRREARDIWKWLVLLALGLLLVEWYVYNRRVRI